MSEGSLHGWFSIQHFRHLFDIHQDLIVSVASTNRATPINTSNRWPGLPKKRHVNHQIKKMKIPLANNKKTSQGNGLFMTQDEKQSFGSSRFKLAYYESKKCSTVD